MKRIWKKLHSESGVSLILALLFFLLCAMVGMSVLAAASSNAGKAKSNREEQQEYFTVSSALQLVCDRLAKAEYKAKASVTEVTVTPSPSPSPSSSPIPSIWYEYKKITYKQESGTVTFDTNSNVNEKWDKILPLRKELDYLFAKRFTKEECNGYHGNGKYEDDNTHTHSTLGGSDVSEPTEHILKIKVDSTGQPGDALDELAEEVEVKVSLGKSGSLGEKKYWLFLEARLPDGDGKFVVKAEMRPTGSFPHINDPNTYNGPYPSSSPNPSPSPGEERAALKWELVRIYKTIEGDED